MHQFFPKPMSRKSETNQDSWQLRVPSIFTEWIAKFGGVLARFLKRSHVCMLPPNKAAKTADFWCLALVFDEDLSTDSSRRSPPQIPNVFRR